MSVKEEKIELDGEVTEALRNGMFRVELENGHKTIGYTAGNIVDIGWLAMQALGGAAALHPSVAGLSRVRRATGEARSGRLLAFAGLAFLCPLTVVTGVQFAHRYTTEVAWFDTLWGSMQEADNQ